MIGKLSGRIEYRTEDHILLDVRGVGYLIYCSERTLMALPGVGQVVALYTDMVVRDDLMQLFGFLSLVEKEWHRLLLTVQGVGAKASLAILGALGPNGVSRAIAMGDWNTVKAARGIGPRAALPGSTFIALGVMAHGASRRAGLGGAPRGFQAVAVNAPGRRR